jgi:alpha-mannosidase
LALSPLLAGFADPAVAAGQDAGQVQDVGAAGQATLYVTATAHLDTQWLWTIQTTIDEYIPRTLHENFALFEKYPNYVFSFEGAFRYMLAREYYPGEYARLEEYIAQGRWHVCGSAVDAGDVNIPSPESLIRHMLLGNGFFRREFGKTSCDIFLPDCFGFGYALPSVAAHCGLKGFSSQKLTWGSSVGIPFDIGVWEGVDGSSILAALNPNDYVSEIRTDLSRDEEWRSRIESLAERGGPSVGYKYFGVGDRGGGPDDESVRWLEKAIAGDGPIRVISAPADKLYRDLTPEQVARLPRYKGELLMTRHGTGCYTSQAAMKRWNRKNEQLADAAERASVAADWLGGATYPKETLRDTWVRFLWHQFHDDLTGTSIPQAYTFSWNDEIIALNRFAGVLGNAVGAVARALDTRAEGIPLVVFNPLAFEREDVVSATVRFAGRAPQAVRVYDADGREVPSQTGRAFEDEVDVVFLARVPSTGFAVFDVQAADSPCNIATGLTVSESTLENERYRVSLDPQGDVVSVFDKSIEREVLTGASRLAMFHNTPDYWSEWEVRYEDIAVEPYAYLTSPARVRVIERGPARGTVEVRREADGSTFLQRIRLAAGMAGDRLEFDTLVDWRTPETLLKAVFPLTASNQTATYDLGFGVIERPSNTEQKYEVPAQQWADLTAADGSFGIAILNDCKYGWDKPDDHTLRLTLIHAPNEIEKDMGWHRFTYALAGHVGDWRSGEVVARAARLNQPLTAFQTVAHPGLLRKRFSLLSVNPSHVAVRAMKQAEETAEIVLRLQETRGQSLSDARVTFAVPIEAAREVDGTEQHLGDAVVRDGALVTDFKPYQPRTFAVRLAPPRDRLPLPATRPVDLPFDTDVVSHDTHRSDGDFDGMGHSLPAELLPATVVSGDVPFVVGPTQLGVDNALTCRGQTITLPSGDFDRLYILAAAVGGRAHGTVTTDNHSVELTVHDYSGWIGQSDSLIGPDGRLLTTETMAPAFIHRDEIAWVGTHRHNGVSDRNEPYVFCCLFKYGIDLPAGANTVTLPDNDRIRVLAMTIAGNTNDDTTAAHPLYDDINPTYIDPPGGLFIRPMHVTLSTDVPDAEIVYTLDGSEPTERSRRYAEPLRLTETTTVSARMLRRGALAEFTSRSAFTFTRPRQPDKPTNIAAGVNFRYYEGEWERLPDFETLTPTASGTAETFDLSLCKQDDHFGFVFDGYLRVPREGVYTFFTASDDGSMLYIGDQEVVNNDGLHGSRERWGAIALAPGLHRLRVLYFDRTGSHSLQVSYEGPGIEKQPIPHYVMYRSGTTPGA